MADSAATAPSRPLVVCGPDGRPIGILEENEKGYRKTIERNRLWALHPGTGRLLPFHEESPVAIADRDGWYEAVLADPSRGADAGEATTGDVRAAEATTGAARPAEATTGVARPAAPQAGAATAAGDAGTESSPAREGADAGRQGRSIGAVLEELVGVIASRHAEMPEGSYTTHLFASGAEKIRKKTGEEAVELILASSRETIVSESADLIYHLLVLLETEGISLGELAAELDRR